MFRNAISNHAAGAAAADVTPLYPERETSPGTQPHPPPSSLPGPAGHTAAGGALPHAAAAPWMERELDLPTLLRLLARQWHLVAGIAALGLLLALALLAQWPRTYTAEAVILIDPDSQPKVEFEELLTGTAPNDQRISSEILVLQAPDLAASVTETLRLADHPDFNPALPQTLPPYAIWRALPAEWLGAAKRWLGLAEPERPLTPEAQLENSAARILAAFASRLEVERIGRSNAVRVAVASHDAELAADTANAIADRYLADQLQAKHTATAVAGAWLDKRVAQLRENAEAAERAVEAYRVETGLIDANGTTILTQQFAELNTQLISARTETAATRARLSQVQGQLNRTGDALAAAEVLSSPLIHRLKEQEVEVLRKRADLAQEYGPKHPRMLGIQAELSDIQEKIAAEVHQIVVGLSNAVAVAQAQEAAIAAAVRQAEAAAAEQGKAQVRLNALEREAEASRTLLQTFLQRMKQVGDQGDIQRPDARIIARATPPEDASHPQSALVLSGFGLGSLLLGLLVACLLALRERGLGNHGFLGSPAVRACLGLPVLATMPELRIPRATLPADQTTEAPYGPYAEAVRMAAAGTGGAKAILVTGAGAGEGKTSLALALARTLAAQGDRVLLIDTDLRRSGLSIALGLDAAPGLAETLLATGGEPAIPFASDRVPGLKVLPAGRSAARHAAAGQSGDRLRPLLDNWREHFDRIVLDSAPAPLVAQTADHARLADATLLTVRWRETSAGSALEAVQRLREAGALLAGVVLTRVDPRRSPAAAAEYGIHTAREPGTAYPAEHRQRRHAAIR